ncbi:MAG: hypothetical protein NTZ57_05040 [Deltaproteobacteria bacterium]|nr:hypothetical protein [Deltaproteobacteria bacterium]
MGKRFFGIVSVILLVVTLWVISSSFPVWSIWSGNESRSRHDSNLSTASVFADEWSGQPDLIIAPAEIDLGLLGPRGARIGSVSLKKTASGVAHWSLLPLTGWDVNDQKNLAGILERENDSLRFHLKILNDQQESKVKGRNIPCPVQLQFESGKQSITFTRKIEPGNYREWVKLETKGGQKSFFIRFKLVDSAAEPLLGIDPIQLDLGRVTQGEQVSRRVKVTNDGWETLKWHAAQDESTASDPGKTSTAGKYVSFLNEDVIGSDHYLAARHLKDKLELQGRWREEQGYPSARSDEHALRYHFTGTSISAYFWKGPSTGQLTAFVDDRFIFQQDGMAQQKERSEWLVADGLSGGPHTLTLVSKNGPVTVEGVKVSGEALMRLPAGHVIISPNNGIVTRQTNYINITAQTKQLPPGSYGGQVAFDSNGGQKEMNLFMEVVPDNIQKILDTYRYVRDLDYFFTTNPVAESVTLQTRGYVKQGIAFRLFIPGTPGTTEFYRWFHPRKGDHFYGYDLKSARRSMRGYILEGTIGNIATSRLTFTRELYRWYHSAKEHYFYSVDPKGEGIQNQGYKYDGIAGYVRP